MKQNSILYNIVFNMQLYCRSKSNNQIFDSFGIAINSFDDPSLDWPKQPFPQNG